MDLVQDGMNTISENVVPEQGIPGIRIRRMVREDIPAVAALEKKTFSEPWNEKGFEDALLGSQNIFLTAVGKEDLIAGYIGLYGSFDEGDITNVAVAEEFRGLGIGFLLVESIKEMASSQGIRQIFLEVRASNAAARALYRKAGFEACGQRKDFYREPVEDAILMRAGI